MDSRYVETQEHPNHAHRWRIAEPSGQTSQGVCRYCGATRQFRNWLGEDDFVTNEEQRVLREAA